MASQVEQAQGTKATAESLFNALQQENAKTIQLQNQVLENQFAAKLMQEEMQATQEKMLTMQQQALDRLAVIQNRVQALVTQTYELHEYPIPRLFVVLPKNPERWDWLNPFTHRFRLYFLCECGEHTKTTANKISHDVHIAKHEGYDVQRTTEFFEKYGSYLLTMMQMVKYGIVAAGVVVPTMGQLKLVEGIESVRAAIDTTKRTLGALMDETIDYVQNQASDNNIVAADGADDSFSQEALEGADLRQLESFLKIKDQAQVLGNLYRIVTTEGHVKWVCLDHYRENYKESATAQLRDLVAVNRGIFDEQQGSVDISLESPSVAKEFYSALVKTRGVQELTIKLAWDATKADLKRFHDAIMKSNVLVLKLNGSSFDSPPRDFINGRSRFDPILWLVIGSKLQSLSLLQCDRFLERVSATKTRTTSKLRTLRWDYRMFAQYSMPIQEASNRIYQQCPNLRELIIDCVDMDTSYFMAKESISALPSLSMLRLIKTPLMDEVAIQIKDGEVSGMDIILEEELKSKILYSGVVNSLTLRGYFFAEYNPEHFESGSFFAANPSLGRLSLDCSLYSLFDAVHQIDKLAYGHQQSLAVTIYDGTSHEIVASLVFQEQISRVTDQSRMLRIEGLNFAIQILYWYYPNLNLARVRDGKAMLLARIFEMHPRNARDMKLGICELSRTGIEGMIRVMNRLEPEIFEILNHKAVDVDLRRMFVSGLDPSWWSKIAKLQLTYQDLDGWMQDLSQVMTRAALPSLQSLAIADEPDSPPLSTQSACWITSLTSRQVDRKSLNWLSICGVSLSVQDWDIVVHGIDLELLKYLSFEESNISKEHLDTLVERFPEKAALEDFILPGWKSTPKSLHN
ncbi:hypothetical protein BGZ58_000525, partial [Dissophora ornata]